MIKKINKASVRIASACAIALASSGAALAHAALDCDFDEGVETVTRLYINGLGLAMTPNQTSAAS